MELSEQVKVGAMTCTVSNMEMSEQVKVGAMTCTVSNMELSEQVKVGAKCSVSDICIYGTVHV